MDHLFAVEGRLCQCLIERSTSNHRFCCLKVSLHEFCPNRKLFTKCQDVSIDIKQDIIQIVDIRVKLDIITGFSTILVYIVAKNNNGLVFQLDRKFRSCRLIAKFDTASTPKQRTVYFVDGPGIIRDNCENIICHRGFNNQKESVFLKNASMKSILWSGYCEDLGNVIVMSYISKNEQTELFTFFLDTFTEECKTVDSSVFIPEEFKNLVTANVLKLSIVTDCESTAYHSDIITLTTDGFFICLQNGRILWALPTSVSDTKTAVLFSWSAYSLNTQFAAILNNNVVTFINTKERKVLDTVTDVVAVYQDDFVGCGQTQILCRLRGFSLAENSGWLLTDKGAWLFDQQTVEEEVDFDKSHKPAVLALRKRLQNELIAFHNKSHTVDTERSKFITDTWRLLLHLNQCSQAKGATESNNIQQISTGKIWQVVYDGKWLVGVNLVNSYDSSLCDLSLSLLPISQDGSQSGKVLHTRSQWLVAENPENRSKFRRKNNGKVTRSTPSPSELQPLERGVVVCETDLPSFVSNSQFSCEAILTLTCFSCSEDERHQSDLRSLYRMQHSCGNVTLEASKLVEEEYSLEMVSEKECESSDNWCEGAVSLLTHIRCDLELRTTWSNASRLADWMKTLCDFHFSADQKCYKTTLQAFSGMKLIIQPQPTHDKALFTVYSNSEKQILLLIRHLYARLADDIVIFPQLSEDDEGLQKAAEAINRELELIKSPQEMLKGGSHIADTVLPETDDRGAILVNNVRENFRKRKEATKSTKGEDRKIVLLQNLYQAQQHTDEATANLTL